MVRHWTPVIPGLAEAAAWSCKELLKDSTRSIVFKYVDPWTFSNRIVFEESWYACFQKMNDLDANDIDPDRTVVNAFIADEHTGRLERVDLHRNVLKLQSIARDAEALGFDARVEFKDHVLEVNFSQGTVSLGPNRTFKFLPRSN